MKTADEMLPYLKETKSIDYHSAIIQREVIRLRENSCSVLDYIKNAYEFVRDEIPHSWDIGSSVVSHSASEVLINRTGICWTKSCLLAGLFRANGIPSGISCQLLTRADNDAGEGYIIHALNTVYIEALDRWIRLDARGNKDGICAEFSIEEEKLAFPIRSELGEIDYNDNNPDLDDRMVRILQESGNVLEITADFAFLKQ